MIGAERSVRATLAAYASVSNMSGQLHSKPLLYGWKNGIRLNGGSYDPNEMIVPEEEMLRQ